MNNKEQIQIGHGLALKGSGPSLVDNKVVHGCYNAESLMTSS